MNQLISLLPHILAQTDCTPVQRVYGIPTWYKYLPGKTDLFSGKCQPTTEFSVDTAFKLTSIGLAAVEILLFLAGLVTVAFIIYGGFQYMTSMGDPERTRSAKDTILNALIGLVIAITASVLVGFIANRLT